MALAINILSLLKPNSFSSDFKAFGVIFLKLKSNSNSSFFGNSSAKLTLDSSIKIECGTKFIYSSLNLASSFSLPSTYNFIDLF